jgi:hypothetical protein
VLRALAGEVQISGARQPAAPGDRAANDRGDFVVRQREARIMEEGWLLHRQERKENMRGESSPNSERTGRLQCGVGTPVMPAAPAG